MVELSQAYLMERFGQRISQARTQLAATWERKNTERPAVIFSDTNYALCGQTDIPLDYFQPETMLAYQSAKIFHHLEHIPDDYVPVLHPWYGTTVVPSALGVPVHYQDYVDPALGAPLMKTPEDVLKLKPPNYETDGQCPQVLACIDFMKNHSDIPVCVTDTQGPFNLALSLVGAVNLFMWMYMEPQAVHHLMKFCTETLIAWVKLQKEHAGLPLTGGAYPHAIEMPNQHGGVAYSEDDIVVINTAQYQEFVVPYHEMLLEAFGGGSMHFCGTGTHQLDTATSTKHLHAINNFCMGNFDQIRALQQKMEGRGPVMACDFNAQDIAWHCGEYAKLAENPCGLILAIFFAPTMALLADGTYTTSNRSTEDVIAQYYHHFKQANLLP